MYFIQRKCTQSDGELLLFYFSCGSENCLWTSTYFSDHLWLVVSQSPVCHPLVTWGHTGPLDQQRLGSTQYQSVCTRSDIAYISPEFVSVYLWEKALSYKATGRNVHFSWTFQLLKVTHHSLQELRALVTQWRGAKSQKNGDPKRKLSLSNWGVAVLLTEAFVFPSDNQEPKDQNPSPSPLILIVFVAFSVCGIWSFTSS